nr:coiled-coil domain containing 106b isoform X1 [Danio rerio]|eukprot:XP_021323729.1 coiled-coil domain containing 106b isoform X1 [Danio rerio]
MTHDFQVSRIKIAPQCTVFSQFSPHYIAIDTISNSQSTSGRFNPICCLPNAVEFGSRFVNIRQVHVTDVIMTDAQRSTRSSRGLKNENGYEISIPFEDSNLDDSGFYSPNDHPFDESASGSIPPCSPYLLITSLRAQLQISLEKNSWLQKRIEDLEEERDFLRCQLDRFIFNTKSRECNGTLEKGTEAEHMQQATGQKQPIKLSTRKTSTPSPMMTRSGKIPVRSQKRSRKNS